MSEQERCPTCGGAVRLVGSRIVSDRGGTSDYEPVKITTIGPATDSTTTYVHVECPECAKLREQLQVAQQDSDCYREQLLAALDEELGLREQLQAAQVQRDGLLLELAQVEVAVLRHKARYKELAEELQAAQAENAALREALEELLTVADLRGDSQLPHPADDPIMWTARMQTAWDEARAALARPSTAGKE